MQVIKTNNDWEAMIKSVDQDQIGADMKLDGTNLGIKFCKKIKMLLEVCGKDCFNH